MQPSTNHTSFLSTRRGKLTLALVCLAGFLDFVDTTIVNVALPSIRHGLGFSVANLQWVISGYLLTYGGLLLLGGRAADLLGRRRLLVTGTIAVRAVLAGRRARRQRCGDDRRPARPRTRRGDDDPRRTVDPDHLVHRRRATGSRRSASGARPSRWPQPSASPSAASSPRARAGAPCSSSTCRSPCVVVDRRACDSSTTTARRAPGREFDLPGAALGTGGLLLLVYALVNASHVGWGTTRTIARARSGRDAAGRVRRDRAAAAQPAGAVLDLPDQRPRRRRRDPGHRPGRLPLDVLLHHPLHAERARVLTDRRQASPTCPSPSGVGIAAGISTGLVARIGTRPIIVAGALIGAAGVYWLSRIPVHGSYLTDLLPGLVIMALGLGAVMVGVQNAANAGVPADKAGLAAALITTSSTVGAALGLAILTAIATSRTNHLIAAHASTAHALTGGFHAALLACSAFLVAAAVIAARATNTRGSAAATASPALIPEAA